MRARIPNSRCQKPTSRALCAAVKAKMRSHIIVMSHFPHLLSGGSGESGAWLNQVNVSPHFPHLLPAWLPRPICLLLFHPHNRFQPWNSDLVFVSLRNMCTGGQACLWISQMRDLFVKWNCSSRVDYCFPCFHWNCSPLSARLDKADSWVQFLPVIVLWLTKKYDPTFVL